MTTKDDSYLVITAEESTMEEAAAQLSAEVNAHLDTHQPHGSLSVAILHSSPGKSRYVLAREMVRQ